MDFFNSVFSEPTPSPSPCPSPSPSPSPPSSPSSPGPSSSSWQFGSTLFKTLASKSESLLDNYYKDFQEFSSGLTKETSVIREIATRAVQDLPGRLESGAAIAQESLEAVGQAIDDVGSTVSEIIGKDLNFANIRLNDQSDDTSGTSSSGGYRDRDSKSTGDDNVKPYNRLEAMIRGVQCDVGTYCNEVDGSGYHDWKVRFTVEDKREEINRLMEENDTIAKIYNEVVPGKVDEETFWCRYFYKVDEVVKAEEARLRIVKRAFSGEDEEELSWDVDDDGDDNEGNEDILKNDVEEKGKGVGNADKEGKGRDDTDAASASGVKSDVAVDEERLTRNEKEGSDGKIGSDISVISSQRSEDDMGWDQIEDIGSGDEGKVGEGGSISSHGQRLNNAEDDEILTWDIEDDEH